jgi:hypothetical protein
MAGSKFPKTLGACVDMAYNLRAERLEYQKKVEAELAVMKKKEDEIEEHILQSFDKSDIEGAKGSVATASVSRMTVPSVKDWPTVFAWIAKKKAWDLMEKRMARVAYRDRMEAGQEIPGVESFVKVSLSLTKVGGN